MSLVPNKRRKQTQSRLIESLVLQGIITALRRISTVGRKSLFQLFPSKFNMPSQAHLLTKMSSLQAHKSNVSTSQVSRSSRNFLRHPTHFNASYVSSTTPKDHKSQNIQNILRSHLQPLNSLKHSEVPDNFKLSKGSHGAHARRGKPSLASKIHRLLRPAQKQDVSQRPVNCSASNQLLPYLQRLKLRSRSSGSSNFHSSRLFYQNFAESHLGQRGKQVLTAITLQRKRGVSAER